MLTAALDTLEASLRRRRCDSVAIGYSRSGVLRLARDLGKPLARHGIGLSRAELRARDVDFWYEVAFRPFGLSDGDLRAAEPVLSASVAAADCSARPARFLGLLGLIRPTGFVLFPATLVGVDRSGPRFHYRTNPIPY
ncbi:MAG: hypothetical protein U1E60_00285 [Reyranellaceae bacterium]